MSPDVDLRRAAPPDVPAIKQLVYTVVRDTYPDVTGEAVFDYGGWDQAWVAEIADAIIGIVLTTDDNVDDLWILRAHHRRGIGRALLAAAETEIAARGYARARLRCNASNTGALAFYAAHGWHEVRRYPHERFPWVMVDHVKELSSGA